ncbi:PAS domain-containing protein [bacterium]|nr:PAS domain-containing protein [bacterium]
MMFNTGELSPEQIEAMLSALPGEITFIDENDIVTWFTDRPNLIFKRELSIIGTDVRQCHSESSFDVVNQLLEEMKSGKRDVAEFRHKDSQDRMILTRYYAVRAIGNQYLGCLEYVEDITRLQTLSGEKRTLD